MLNVYIVDYQRLFKYNGLNTYLSRLTNVFLEKREIRLHYIWLACKIDALFSKEVEDRVVHYLFSKDITALDGVTGNDDNFVNYLADEMAGKENVIIHFNWINHCPFAYLLKQRIRCKTILTKHCIPWRDNITINYPLFCRLNQLFNEKEKRLSVSPLALHREQYSYCAMDHIICVTESGRKSLKKMFQFPLDKMIVINNGLEISKSDGASRREKIELRELYGFRPDETIILFAGSITERKGAFDLAKAFDELVSENPTEKVRLVFAGNGDHNILLSAVNNAPVTF